MGDYQNLYPLPLGVSKEQDKLMDLYDKIYNKVSRRVYEESVQGGGKVLARKDEAKAKEAEKGELRASKLGVKNEVTKEKKSKKETPLKRNHVASMD